MRKNILALTFIGLFSFLSNIANAQTVEIAKVPEKEEQKSEFRANFKRVAIDVNSTNVKHGSRYKNSSVSALSADNETNLKGVFDFALEYETEKYRWDQIIFMNYGRKKSKTVDDGKSSIDEINDEIRVETDYSYKVWKFNEADISPFANLGYQTEFTRNKGADKTQIIRLKSGMKLFNGKYIDNIYVAGVGEYDMTYNPYQEKLAMEIGGKTKYNLREGVDFALEGYYRNYMHYSKYHYEDLKYDLNVTARMDVAIVSKLMLSPFVSYRYAESRGAGKPGSNFMIGLSGAYADIFKI